mmetsp:Transcript_1371/g.3385  ORF Transcript_1371/g.3385 Transcript_1371/m.3385 type:complete len:440 (+) Transcript_1371:1216-2535(+)
MRQDCQEGLRVAAATDGPALAVEEGQVDAHLPRELGQRFLRLVLRPAGGQPTGVLRGIGIADHDLLLSADAAHVGGDAVQLPHGVGGAVQIVQRFEQRDDAERRCDTRISLQEQDGQNVAGGCALADHVRAKAVLVLLCDHLERLQRVDGGVREDVGMVVPHTRPDQRALGAELLLQPAEFGVLVPLREAAQSKVPSDGIQGFLVTIGFLADVQRHHGKSEGRDLAQDVGQHAIGVQLVAHLAQRAVHEEQFVQQHLLGQVDVGAIVHGCVGLVHDHHAAGAALRLLLLLPGPFLRALHLGDHLADVGAVRLAGVAIAVGFVQLIGACDEGQFTFQLLQVLTQQPGSLGSLAHADGLGGLGSHVGIAVTVASHPAGKDYGSSRERQLGIGGVRLQGGIELAQEGRKGIPQDGFDDQCSPLGFIFGSWFGAGNFVGQPKG